MKGKLDHKWSAFYFCIILCLFFPCSCPIRRSALQPHRDQCQRHTFAKTIPHTSHPSTSHACTHTNTRARTFILPLFWHLIPEGKQLKEAHLSHTFQSPTTPHVTATWGSLSLSPCLTASLSWQVIRWCHRPEGVWRSSHEVPRQPLREFCQQPL